jgi:hypothetical protein
VCHRLEKLYHPHRRLVIDEVFYSILNFKFQIKEMVLGRKTTGELNESYDPEPTQAAEQSLKIHHQTRQCLNYTLDLEKQRVQY